MFVSVIAGLAFGLCVPAAAQELGVGTRITGSAATVYGRTIPLPAGGEWLVVGQSGNQSTLGTGIRRIILAQESGGRLARWVYVDTNPNQRESSSRSHWFRDPDICDRKDVHFAFSDTDYSDKNMSCWILNHTGMTLGSKASQASVDFYRWSDQRARPNTALSIQVYLVRSFDLLRVEYFFNPVLDGFAETPTAVWRGNPWHADIASKDPRKLAYLKALKAQGETLFQALQASFH
jgi:hypothetical protein